jgi:signal transduction histidine kinase
MAAVLRDGFSEAGSGTIEGLQPAVLRARPQLSIADFDFLASRVGALSEATGVLHDDFEARLKDAPAQAVDLAGLSLPAVADGWYVESRDDGSIRGVRCELSRVLDAVRHDLRSHHALADQDTVELEGGIPLRAPLAKLGTVISSPTLDADEAAIRKAFRVDRWCTALFLLGMGGLGMLAGFGRLRHSTLISERLAALVRSPRSPLVSLRHEAQHLERTPGDVERGTAEEAHEMLGEITRVNAALENISAYDRLDRGAWKPHFLPMALSDVLPAVRAEMSGCTRASVRLRAEGIEALSLRGDVDMLRLVFANLTRNACQYNERNPVEIRVSAMRSKHLHIRFTDNGVGLPEAVKPGDAKTPVHPGGAADRSSGLGLILCRQILELHHGAFALVSSASSGTTFEITLP